MKKWKVKFKTNVSRKWVETEKEFINRESAEFFAASIKILSPFDVEVKAFAEESNV